MSIRSTRRGRLTAVLAGMLVPLVLLAGILLPTTLEQTEAGWTDTTQVQATAAAATIPAPTLTRECVFMNYLLYSEVHIYWRLPVGYGLEDARLEASTAGLGSVLAPLTGFNLTSSTSPQGGREYRTDIPTNLLGGLLGLGTELEVAIQVEDESGWVSDSVSIASDAGVALGLGGSCRNLP